MQSKVDIAHRQNGKNKHKKLKNTLKVYSFMYSTKSFSIFRLVICLKAKRIIFKKNLFVFKLSFIQDCVICRYDQQIIDTQTKFFQKILNAFLGS